MTFSAEPKLVSCENRLSAFVENVESYKFLCLLLLNCQLPCFKFKSFILSLSGSLIDVWATATVNKHNGELVLVFHDFDNQKTVILLVIGYYFF